MTSNIIAFPVIPRREARLATARAAQESCLFFQRTADDARAFADAGDCEAALREIGRLVAFELAPGAAPPLPHMRVALVIELVEYLISRPARASA